MTMTMTMTVTTRMMTIVDDSEEKDDGIKADNEDYEKNKDFT